MEELCFTASRHTQTLILFIVSRRSFYINIYFFEAGQGKAKLNNVSLLFRIQSSINDMYNSIALFRHSLIMCNDNHCFSLFVDLLE